MTAPKYIAYPKALEILIDRLGGTTPEELAAWVWLEPKNGGLTAYLGGLTAYLNANELVPPPKFTYDYTMGMDYLSPLMACWFLEDDIANFKHVNRYITGKLLIERWSRQLCNQAEAFILAKIAETRLMDIHPTFGVTKASNSSDDAFPPLESGLFDLSEIEAIERDDFELEHNSVSGGKENKKKESVTERKQRLECWIQEERELRGDIGAQRRTADRENIKRQTLSAILKRAK